MADFRENCADYSILLPNCQTSINVLFKPFEPHPVIILAIISAVVGSLAAIQGPIILMSQRRQAKRDRLRAEHDYQVNLKAELEIRYLNEKIDRLLEYQRQQGQRKPYQ